MARLLLIEDDDMVRETMSAIIIELGHALDVATCKRDADQRISQAGYDLIITDVTLPDGSGYDIASRAAAMNIKSIVVSGYHDPIRATGHVFLAKPFTVLALELKINEQLRALQ